jgi:hypothetical protein
LALDFLKEEDFPQSSYTNVMLCVNRIPPEQKNGFLRCSAYFEYPQSKHQTVCSPGNSLLCGNPNTTGATLSGTPSSKEQYSAGATSPLLLWSLTTMLKQIALREILLLEETQG